MANNSNNNSSACGKSSAISIGGPSAGKAVPAQYSERKVIKKSDWREWQNRALKAERENGFLKLKLEKAEMSPTHIWRRIKAYWFGNEFYLGKISTLRVFKSLSGSIHTTLWIHNTDMYYKSVWIQKFDGGGEEKHVYFYIRIPFTDYLITYSNKDKKFRIKRWEEECGGDPCSAG